MPTNAIFRHVFSLAVAAAEEDVVNKKTEEGQEERHGGWGFGSQTSLPNCVVIVLQHS